MWAVLCIKHFAHILFKFQEQSSKFKEIEDRAVAAEQKLQQRMSSWEEQKKAKASETKKLEARCADLVNQNSTLHSQLEKVCSLIHWFYFIFARKIYVRTQIKITRQWKSTGTQSLLALRMVESLCSGYLKYLLYWSVTFVESVFLFTFQLSAQLAVSKESSLNISLPPKEGVSAEGGSEDNKTVEELWEIIR